MSERWHIFCFDFLFSDMLTIWKWTSPYFRVVLAASLRLFLNILVLSFLSSPPARTAPSTVPSPARQIKHFRFPRVQAIKTLSYQDQNQYHRYFSTLIRLKGLKVSSWISQSISLSCFIRSNFRAMKLDPLCIPQILLFTRKGEQQPNIYLSA